LVRNGLSCLDDHEDHPRTNHCLRAVDDVEMLKIIDIPARNGFATPMVELLA
jgi:hypothetical protein